MVSWRGGGGAWVEGVLVVVVVVGEFLEGELDVDEGGEGLDRAVVLRVLEEVADAGLEVGVPVEDVELAVQEGLGRGVSHGVGGSGSRPRWWPEGGGYLFLLEELAICTGCCHVFVGALVVMVCGVLKEKLARPADGLVSELPRPVEEREPRGERSNPSPRGESWTR